MNLKTISWISGVAMLCCAAVANLWHPAVVEGPAFSLATSIPTQFGAWRVDGSVMPVVPSPDLQATLDQVYRQVVSRTYINDLGERMMLVVGFGGDQSDSLKGHRQEVCYAAQGFSILDIRNDHLTLARGQVPIVRMHAQKGTRSEPVSYWFTMGDRVMIGRAERVLGQIRYGLAGEIPDGLLLRVSNITRNTRDGYAAQDAFLRDLLAAVDPATRQRLAGRDS